MSRSLLLALDLGTTSVRALLVDADGTVRGRAHRPLGMRFPAPGHVEQDPIAMWEQSVAVLREALTVGGAHASEVAGLGVVAQRATALAWDATTGQPLTWAIGWQDQRTAAWAAALRAQGVGVTTVATLGRFVWWLENEPAVRRAAETGTLRLGTPDAWLTGCLTGGTVHATDPGHASCTGLYDLAQGGGWSQLALDFFRIEERFLPRIVATSEVVAETDAALLGAPVPVAARAGDQQAATFAQGVHGPGQAKLTLGTAAMADLHTGTTPGEHRDGAFALALWRLADGADVFCLEASVFTAGACVDWLVTLGLLPAAEQLDAVASSVASSEGVAFVPALQGLGTPYADDDARGLFGGLTRGTKAAHLVRAVLEGIAQRCTDVCEALPLAQGPLRVDGGLARSRLLLQRLADLAGRPLLRAAETETTALGAAHLAGLATGIWKSPSDCAATLASPETVTPQEDAAWREQNRTRWRSVVARARSHGGGA